MIAFCFLIKKGCCLHQAPVGGTSNTLYQPDLYVSKLENDTTKPGDMVLIGEAKNHTFRKSLIQSISYSIAVMGNAQYKRLFRMHLGLPYTRHKAQLELHVEVNKSIWRIPIAMASLSDKAFLCLVYVGVHYLPGHNIYVGSALRKSLPFKNWLNDDYAVKGARDYYAEDGVNSGCVFIHSETVYKFYENI